MARYRVGLVVLVGGEVVEVASVPVEAADAASARALVDVALPVRYTVEVDPHDPYEDIAAEEIMGRDGIGPLAG